MGQIILIALAALAIITVAGHFYSGLWTKLLISGRHKDIEEIFNTGKIPENWKNPEAKTQDLIKYVKNTKLMTDEQTRKEVQTRLEEALKAWQAGSH